MASDDKNIIQNKNKYKIKYPHNFYREARNFLDRFVYIYNFNLCLVEINFVHLLYCLPLFSNKQHKNKKIKRSNNTQKIEIYNGN